jgi:hypothetical protein
MKLSKLITENTIQPIHKRVLRAMTLSLGETDDVSDIWGFLTKTLNIEDMVLKLELLHLFVNNFNEDGNYEGVTDSDLDDIDDLSNYYDEHLALADWSNLPPIMIEDTDEEHFGLKVFRNIEDDEKFAVGTDSDVERAMEGYFDGWVDNMGYDNIDTSLIEDFIELNDYSLNSLASEEANYRVDEMDEDDIISEAGYDKDEFEEQISNIEYRIEEIESEISDLEDEMSDLEEDNEEGENDSDIEDVGIKMRELSSEMDDLGNQLEDKKSELDSLVDTARDELIEKYDEEMRERVIDSGLSYFTDDLGMSKEDAIRYYYDFDESGLEAYLAENEDAGNTLASYDGNENHESYGGTYYYIYRIE